MADLADPTRRAFLASAGGVALTLCLGGCSASPVAGGSASGVATGAASGGATTVPVADIPVGAGRIVGSYVVTQPTEGTFQAFGHLCTHQNLPIQDVTDAAIVCGRHGSSFSLADGSVLTGPATKALTPATVTINGDTLTIGG